MRTQHEHRTNTTWHTRIAKTREKRPIPHNAKAIANKAVILGARIAHGEDDR
jgi:hypothetical protein